MKNAHLIPPKTRRPKRIIRAKVSSVYHVVSRTTGRARLFKDIEKQQFIDLLERVAGFCGVDVLTYAILSNHFHLLVEVPGGVGDLPDDELLRRVRLLYGKERKRQPLSYARVDLALKTGGETRAAMRELLLARMGSLPIFMKILKQRFSLIYNDLHDRCGTLWEDRFHSVLVEDSPCALTAVAAYIDLNPVRAGIVERPEDDHFTGYGRAVGRKNGLQTHRFFVRLAGRHSENLGQIAAAYRTYLFISGSNPTKGGTVPVRDLEKVLAQGGELPPAALLRHRLRFMTRGAIIGTKRFVESWRPRATTTSKRKQSRPPKPCTPSSTEALHSLR